MCEEVGNKPGRKPKPKVTEGQIRGGKYLRNIMSLLAPLHAHKDCHNRKLHYDEYVAYLLLYFFTPVLDSLRGLQQASNFKSLQRKFGLRRFSLGSFSAAGRVFDPELLEPIIGELAAQLNHARTPHTFPTWRGRLRPWMDRRCTPCPRWSGRCGGTRSTAPRRCTPTSTCSRPRPCKPRSPRATRMSLGC